jgi:hypothetical protein
MLSRYHWGDNWTTFDFHSVQEKSLFYIADLFNLFGRNSNKQRRHASKISLHSTVGFDQCLALPGGIGSICRGEGFLPERFKFSLKKSSYLSIHQ